MESGKKKLPPGFGPIGVQLLFDKPPPVNPAAIAARIQARRPRAKLIDGSNPEILLFAHEDKLATFAGDKKVPGQTTVIYAGPLKDRAPVQNSLQQTWEWPGAADVVASCSHLVVVMEMMTLTMPRNDRIEIFLPSLAGVVEALQPKALNWHQTQRLQDPTVFLKDSGSEKPEVRLRSLMNVRLFNIQGTEGDVVMDSLGLSALGLPDIQVHARGLDVRRLGAHLYNCALHLLDRGDVIEDGQTIAGLEPEEKWPCQHEMALVKPERVVLDLQPGPANAAGKRAKKN